MRRSAPADPVMPNHRLMLAAVLLVDTPKRLLNLGLGGGVFERLPKLQVAFAHGGGSFPATIGRIEHGFNVRPDLCAVDNNVNPREYLGKFYLDSLVHEPAVLNQLIDLIGADKIALGSDYPFPLGEIEPGKMIESMTNLDESTKEWLLNGSALEWLNLDKSRFIN